MSQQVSEYEYYKRIKLLGEGSFGKAYLVECVSDGSLCVIKQVDLSKMSESEKKETLKEAKILEAFNHPNIVRFREVYKTKKGKLCIVMDYADGGDLAKKVSGQKGTYFPETQILDWFTQICLALKHVHDRKVLHRDLKCQNIFLTKTNMIKLGDFGIARVLSNTRENAKTMVGTPYYLSPEIINGKAYSFKSDIWSLGVVLYELCALKPPFDASSLPFLAMKIVKGQYNPIPSVYSKELKNLVAFLLQLDPSKRPTTNQVLKMPIIQERIKNFLSESVRITEFSHTILHNKKFVQGEIKLYDVKQVNNEVPIPQNLLNKNQDLTPNQQKPPLPSNNANKQDPNVQKPPLQNPVVNQQKQVVQQTPPQSNQGNRPNVNKPPISVPSSNNAQQQNPISNHNPKPNYHYNQGNQQQNNQKNIIPPYNGPKIVDASKDKPVVQPYNGPKIVDASKDIPYNQMQNQQKNQMGRAPSEGKLRNEAPHLQRVYSEFNAIENNKMVAQKPSSDNSKDAIKKPQPQNQPEIKKEVKPQNLDKYNWLDEKKKEVNPNMELNRNKWVQKPISEPTKQPEQKQIIDINKNDFKSPPQSNQANRERPIQKAAEREIMGGGGGFVAFYEAPKKNDKQERKPTRQAISEDRPKPKFEKPAEDPKKKEEEREQREREREEKRKEMLEDLKKKREGAKNNVKFEFIGFEGGKDGSDKVDEKPIPKRDAEPLKKEEKKRPAWVIEANKDRNNQPKGGNTADEKKNENNNKEAIKEKPKEVIREKEPEEKKVQEKPPTRQNEIKKHKWMEDVNEVQLEIQRMKEKIDQNVVLNKREKEELKEFDDLINELNKIIEDPEIENDQESETSEKKKSEREDHDEDRDDEFDDDPVSTNPSSQNQVIDEVSNESMEYMSDFNKLENLRIVLEGALGIDAFLKAYKITKDLCQKYQLDEIEQKYGKKDNYASVFPFISKEKIDRYLPLMFTFVLMEDMTEGTKI